MFVPLFFRNFLARTDYTPEVTHVHMEVRALFMMSNTGTLATSEVGRRLGISKPNVTALLDKLVAKGYVEREPDRNDRRVINITVTEKGRRFIGKRLRIFRDIMKGNMTVLDAGEIEALSSALETVRYIITIMGTRNRLAGDTQTGANLKVNV